MGKPLKELMDLNIRTVQNFKFMNPIELFQGRSADKILERNMDVLVHNGHNALNYVQHVFLIMEQNLVHNGSDLVDDFEATIKEASSASKRNMKEVMKAVTSSVTKKKTTPKKKTVQLKKSAAKGKTVQPAAAKKSTGVLISKATPTKNKAKKIKPHSDASAKNMGSLVRTAHNKSHKKTSASRPSKVVSSAKKAS